MSNYDTDRAMLIHPEAYAASLVEALNSPTRAAIEFARMVRDGSRGCGRLPPEYIADVFKALIWQAKAAGE